MKSIKNIGVVTATRAEYGLLVPLLNLLVARKEFKLKLFVTGTHLSHEFGFTKNQILSDGFEITDEIDSVISNDTASAIGKTSALTLMGLVDSYERHKPDIIFLLGDRYEMLCAAMAATICRIPIAHLHGGEITEGAYDDGFRHAITKMSHLHFTSSKEHQNRVIQMGENPNFVYNVGALGIDNIKKINPMSKKDLEESLDFKFQKHNLLVTVHPETLKIGSSKNNIDLLLKCISSLKDTFVIFTGTNADSEGRIINRLLKEYCNKNINSLFVTSLGQLRYISILRYVDAVIGNSSSGIIEVPSFNIPTIDIGDRQKGRLRANSVIGVSWDSDEIINAIKSVYTEDIIYLENPYGEGNTSEAIIEKLIKINNYKSLIRKKFFDFKKE